MYRPKALTELRQSLSFNPFDEMSQDVIKYSDLLIIEPICIRDEEIGNTTQYIKTVSTDEIAICPGAARQCGLRVQGLPSANYPPCGHLNADHVGCHLAPKQCSKFVNVGARVARVNEISAIAATPRPCSTG